jgi:hypothetical protein
MTGILAVKEQGASTNPKPGDLVRHYKGGIYCVLLIAKDEADPSKERVIYCAATPDKNGRRPIWDRTITSWTSPAGGFARYVTITRDEAPKKSRGTP